MADLLIRNLTDADKKALEQRAREHGRSQQAEALCILKEGLKESKPSWIRILRNAVDSVGGIELELPARKPGRTIDTSEWS